MAGSLFDNLHEPQSRPSANRGAQGFLSEQPVQEDPHIRTMSGLRPCSYRKSPMGRPSLFRSSGARDSPFGLVKGGSFQAASLTANTWRQQTGPLNRCGMDDRQGTWSNNEAHMASFGARGTTLSVTDVLVETTSNALTPADESEPL